EPADHLVKRRPVEPRIDEGIQPRAFLGSVTEQRLRIVRQKDDFPLDLRPPVHGFALQQHIARVRIVNAGHRLEQRRLARPVSADEPGHHSRTQFERYVLQHRLALNRFVKVTNRQHFHPSSSVRFLLPPTPSPARGSPPGDALPPSTFPDPPAGGRAVPAACREKTPVWPRTRPCPARTR